MVYPVIAGYGAAGGRTIGYDAGVRALVEEGLGEHAIPAAVTGDGHCHGSRKRSEEFVKLGTLGGA